jgi:hypothetical protein
LSVRAAFCLTLPLVAGVIIGQRRDSTLFALGALWAVSQDGLDSWHVRSHRLLSVVVGSGLGFALGVIFVSLTSVSVLLLLLYAGVALAAGLLEASGLPAGGMYVLLGAIVGGGLRLGGSGWLACVLVSAGALWVWFVAAATDHRSRRERERICVAEGLEDLAACLRAVGGSDFASARREATRLLDTAQDVVGTRPPRPDDPEEVAMFQCLTAALRCGEIVSFLAGTGAEIPQQLCTALDRSASELRQGSADRAVVVLEGPDVVGPTTEARVGSVIRQALHEPEPVLTEARVYPSTRFSLLLSERFRFGVVLAASIALAAVVARVLRGLHSFWLPLAVAFIARPDLGPLIPRAMERTVGTLTGVGIAAAVSITGNSLLLLIVLSCLMAAAVPWASRRSHALTVIAFTPIVFVFLSVLGPDQYLFVPRIVDTALGAAIVLFMDVAFWSTAPSFRPSAQVERSRRAVSSYEACDQRTDVNEHHLRRRRAFRAITDARASVVRALSEPLAWRRPDPGLLQQLDRLSVAIDAHTVAMLTEEAK